MLSPKPLIIRRFCLLLCLLISVIKLEGQCNPPDQLPTTQCEDAPLTCLNDACYSTSNMADQGNAGFCGSSTVVHNPQYFEIIPIASCIQIDIHVDECAGGNALQSALVTSCNWAPCPGFSVPCADILDCDPQQFVGGTMVLSACGLTPGVPLWILIDGSNAAICQYTITFADGIFEPQIDENLTFGGANPSIVCQGFDDLNMSVGPPITNAHGYIWDLGWTGTNITTTLPDIQVDIPDNLAPDIYDVCVLAFSGCDTSDIPFCFQVEVVEIPPAIKDPATFCQEELGFNWHGQIISGAGEYEASFESPDGCRYDSSWTVEEYPEVPVGLLDTLHCLDEAGDAFNYEGETYDNAGIYELEYPGMGLNGCDSTAELNLTLVGLDAFIELTCDNGEFELEVLIQEQIPINANVSFEWFDGGSTPIWDLNPLLVTVGGCYEVEVTLETAVGSCVFLLDQYCFDAASYRPPAPVTNGDTLICPQEVIFEVIVDPFADEYDYYWSAPTDVDIWQNQSETVTMDFSFSAGGEVCVYATNECGDGPTTCFDVEIITPPTAGFSLAPEICSGATTVVTFTGFGGPSAIFLWDFDSPASVSGSGRGPYIVSWNITGDKIVTLQIIEPGCDTAMIADTITVSSLLPPVINCSSTINSVDFDWTDVAGSNGYLVAINNDPPVATGNSNFGLTGLAPGTEVIMTLTVVSGGPCPDIVLMDTCRAEDCPPPVIDLSGPDSLCLNAPGIITLDALVDGLPGTGIWTGPGIVDGTAGLFDPTVSGFGQHQVIYTVDQGACSFQEAYLMTVFDSMTADFIVDPLICETDVANVIYMGNSPGANFMWDFGSATVVSGSGPGPYQISYSSPGPKPVRLRISQNGCSSDLITQNLVVSPTLTAPVVNCQPTTSDVTFVWTDDNPGGYQVNILSGHTGVPMIPEINFPGLVPGDSVVIEIISLSIGPCPLRKDTFSCVARACPIVDLNIDPVPDICLYSGTSPFDLQVTITGGAGVGDWSGPGITDPVKGTFDPMVADAGSHVVTFHYLYDGCDYYESTNIDVFDPPVAFISNTNLVLTCAGGNKLLLDGSGSSGGSLSFEWSTTGGLFNTPTNLDKVEVGGDGTYQLKVYDAISGCVDSTSVVVIQDAGIPDADAGPDKVITCDSTTFVLGGASSTGTDIVYTWSTSNGNIVGPSDGITIMANKVGDYTITVLDTANGCESADVAKITIDTATATVTLAPGDTIDCNTTLSGVESTLSATITDYNFLWSTVDGTISGDSTGPNVQVSQGGTYMLTITNKQNGCERSASAFVAESDEIIDAVDVALTNVICFGDHNGTLTINGVTGGTPPYTYEWSVSDPSSLGPGQYGLTVTDQNGCSFTQQFTITEPPKVTADLGPNFTAAAGDSVTINLLTNVNLNEILDITWTGNNVVNCPRCPSLQFIATKTGTIVAMVTDSAGCSATDSLRLTVIVPRIIFVPTIFHPNDDGVNDVFFISGKPNLIQIPYLQIYDRWGNLIFEKIDGTPGVKADGWDGRFNGEEYMQPGVYVYVAKLKYDDGLEETIKGGITIIR